MPYPIDLYVLVADLDQQQTLLALLGQRAESLGIRTLTFEVTKHPQHDGGCFKTAPALLQSLQQHAQHAMVVLDREGSGAEDLASEAIETDIEARLARSGWDDRARAIAVDPEIENWVWTPSPHVDAILGWRGRTPSLRAWLQQQGFLAAGQRKPPRPKEAFRAALRESRIRPSAALFGELARAVSLERCEDRSFIRLRQTLREWFPA